MRKRLIVSALVFAAAALSLVMLSPASSQAVPAPTVCTGTYNNATLGSVSVPSYSSCVLNNSRVRGSIDVSPDASLRTCATTIDGSVNANRAYVNMDSRTVVNGSVHLNESGTMMFKILSCGGDVGPGQYGAYICPRLIGGNLYITNGANGSLEVEVGDCGSVNIHGMVRITGNDQAVTLANSKVLGSVTCLDNDPLAVLENTWVTGSIHGYCASANA